MATSRDVRVRAFEFAVDVLKLCRVVAERDWVLRRLAFQLVDSAGSIGANLEEAAAGQTKPDFIAKTCIALKEAQEARHWLRLLDATSDGLAARIQPLIDESSEIVAMLVAGVRKARSNPHRGDNH